MSTSATHTLGDAGVAIIKYPPFRPEWTDRPDGRVTTSVLAGGDSSGGRTSLNFTLPRVWHNKRYIRIHRLEAAKTGATGNEVAAVFLSMVLDTPNTVIRQDWGTSVRAPTAFGAGDTYVRNASETGIEGTWWHFPQAGDITIGTIMDNPGFGESTILRVWLDYWEIPTQGV